MNGEISLLDFFQSIAEIFSSKRRITAERSETTGSRALASLAIVAAQNLTDAALLLRVVTPRFLTSRRENQLEVGIKPLI